MGIIIKWLVAGGIIVFFLVWFIGGYLHAKRRVRKGLKPLCYHRVRSCSSNDLAELISSSSCSHAISEQSSSPRTTSPSIDKTTRVTRWTTTAPPHRSTTPSTLLLRIIWPHGSPLKPFHRKRGLLLRQGLPREVSQPMRQVFDRVQSRVVRKGEGLDPQAFHALNASSKLNTFSK